MCFPIRKITKSITTNYAPVCLLEKRNRTRLLWVAKTKKKLATTIVVANYDKLAF